MTESWLTQWLNKSPWIIRHDSWGHLGLKPVASVGIAQIRTDGFPIGSAEWFCRGPVWKCGLGLTALTGFLWQNTCQLWRFINWIFSFTPWWWGSWRQFTLTALIGHWYQSQTVMRHILFQSGNSCSLSGTHSSCYQGTWRTRKFISATQGKDTNLRVMLPSNFGHSKWNISSPISENMTCGSCSQIWSPYPWVRDRI